MGDCDGVTQSERRWSFPVTAFDVVSMVSRQEVQPPLNLTTMFCLLFFQAGGLLAQLGSIKDLLAEPPMVSCLCQMIREIR